MYLTRNQAMRQRIRGFESHPLRHTRPCIGPSLSSSPPISILIPGAALNCMSSHRLPHSCSAAFAPDENVMGRIAAVRSRESFDREENLGT